MALITCQNLSLGYEGHTIRDNINFTVNEGDYLYIVGENGSGKTTLMKTILNLLKPIEGSILTSDGLKQTEIGYLPQQTEVQKDFPASVYEIVLSGNQSKMKLRPFYTKHEKELAIKNMELLNILDLKNKSYKELSGGQQQRVLLSRALCASTKCLLLDEPVSGLDPKVSEDMYSLIENLNKNGMTIIMISHDIKAALKYATHILHIGQNTFFGSKKEYLNSPMGKYYQALKKGDE